jgi:SAM-dependent methyltransferase
MHIDVGGEGRFSTAYNLNPRTTTTTTGIPGQPIPNLVLGVGERMPFPDHSANLITIENAPIRPRAASELARVIKPGGTILLWHPTPYAQVTHSSVAFAAGGVWRQVTLNGETLTIITAT